MYRVVFPQWQKPPVSPSLRAGCVDIWRIDLASLTANPNAPDPVVGHSRDPNHPAAGQRAAGRRAMRRILSRYLDVPDSELQFDAHPGGKPYLAAPRQPLEFNLSHSSDIALLAIATECAVGIDVETHRELEDPLRLARRVMSAQEVQQLAALPAESRLELFLDLWTRMEARQKSIGRGIFAQPADPELLSSFGFRPSDRSYASLAVSPASPEPDLRFFDFSRL